MDWQPVDEPGRSAWPSGPRSLHPLTTWVVVLTILLLVGQLVQVFIVREFTSVGGTAPDLRAGLRQMLVILPVSLLNIAQTVVALVWMYKASDNVTKWGMRDRQWGPGWAVGSWFIPLANLVLPLLPLLEIWKGSRPDAQPATWKRAPFPPLLDTLWGFWVGAQFVGLGAGLMVAIRNALEGEASQVPLAATLAQTGLYLVAGVLFIMFVRQVAQMQAQRMGGMPERPTYS